ncbi:MAG: hypothetical protein KF721_15475 [Ignavibacteriaceae bacterium]|nr:hypothetical protein [Ignavibacteriaceae bacterium]
MTINEFNPVQTTPYHINHKLKIYLWKLINKTIFRMIPNQIRKPRIWMLNLFGANISSNCFIHRNSNIEHPWNLEMGSLSSIGEYSWIYCLDKIRIGEKSTIGKDVYLITGGHDVSDKNFTLETKPICIKDGVWIATGCYILPGIILENFTVVAARSIVTKSTNEFDIIGGAPANFIRKRNFRVT